MALKKDGAAVRSLAARENSRIINAPPKHNIKHEEETINAGRVVEAMSKSPGWILVKEWISNEWDFNNMFSSYTKENNKEGFDIKMKELSGINKLMKHIDVMIANGKAAQKRLEEYQKQAKDQ